MKEMGTKGERRQPLLYSESSTQTQCSIPNNTDLYESFFEKNCVQREQAIRKKKHNSRINRGKTNINKKNSRSRNAKRNVGDSMDAMRISNDVSVEYLSKSVFYFH